MQLVKWAEGLKIKDSDNLLVTSSESVFQGNGSPGTYFEFTETETVLHQDTVPSFPWWQTGPGGVSSALALCVITGARWGPCCGVNQHPRRKVYVLQFLHLERGCDNRYTFGVGCVWYTGSGSQGLVGPISGSQWLVVLLLVLDTHSLCGMPATSSVHCSLF